MITGKHHAGLCGASAASSNCTEQTEPLLGRYDSLSGARAFVQPFRSPRHTASRQQGGGSASAPNEPVEITTCSEGVAFRVNRSDSSSMDRQDVAAAPTLAVADPQPDPKVIPLAMAVSQSGSNNAVVDDESATSALFLQLEPADHHTRQKQPSAQQASPEAEQVPVDTLLAKGADSEIMSAQQLLTAAEQTVADADSVQPMTDDQFPTNLPAAATEQEHVDSEPTQNATSEDSLTQQADFAAGSVTVEQGEHQHIKQHNAHLCDVCLSTRTDTSLCPLSVRLPVCLSVTRPWTLCHHTVCTLRSQQAMRPAAQ